METRKFLVRFSAWGSRGPAGGTRGSHGLAGARVPIYGRARGCTVDWRGNVAAPHWVGAVGAVHAGVRGVGASGVTRGGFLLAARWTRGSLWFGGCTGCVHQAQRTRGPDTWRAGIRRATVRVRAAGGVAGGGW